MFGIFREELAVTILMVAFFALSILGRLILGMLYRHMIREADNMATTENNLLKQCKLKFTNCYQMNKGMPNISIFVDKFLSRLAIGPLSFETIYHLSGQMMLLSIVCSGVGVCRSILAGRLMGEILPFYAASLLELYLFFSVTTLVDVRGYKRILKINLVDYLENHLSARIDVTDKDIEKLYGSKKLQVMTINKEQTPEGNGTAADISRTHDSGNAEENWTIREGRMAQAQTERKRVVQEAAAAQEARFTEDQEKELESLLSEFLTS